jgi:predicted nucleic acid-binding protein
MRLFLDANVLFTAAHNPEGRSAAIVDLARQGRCSLLTSPHAATEARRNIRVKYPEVLGRLDGLFEVVEMVGEASPADVAGVLEQQLPLKDAPVLAAAIASGAEVLVTGDRMHFGHLFGRRVRGVKVLSPADALGLLLS